jgi:uncharacterized cysteine cluster protein YcgN (CxxCxxCC family)
MSCQIYDGSLVSKDECKKLTAQNLDHVANLPPETKAAILVQHKKDYPDNTFLYLSGVVVILLVWKFVF